MSALPLIITAVLAIGAARAAAAKVNIHTVVPVECTDSYFEWQVIGLAYSFRRAGQPGPLTRLLSCSEEQLKTYKGLDIMPTFVAPNLEYDVELEDHYAPYNKPSAIAAWLREAEPEEEFIMVIDADSILRMPFIPERLGVERGWAYTPYFLEYLDGVQNELALKHVPNVAPRQDWLAGPYGRRADKVGPPYVVHKEDLKVVAPAWYEFTRAVRADPAAWNLTGDTSIKQPGGRTWISEMYGYLFAAASAGVWHRQLDYSANLVPGTGPIGPPKVLHYGNDLSVNGTGYTFSKIALRQAGFDATVCPPWHPDQSRLWGGLLPYPPSPLSLTGQGMDLLQDLTSIEPAIVLNAAFCERHLKECSVSPELQQKCAEVAQQEAELDEAYDLLELQLRAATCEDSMEACTEWKEEGQCDKNPRFMHYGCRQSCGSCFAPDVEARWHGRDEERAASAASGAGVIAAEERTQQLSVGMLSEKCMDAAGVDRGAGPCLEADDSAQEEEDSAEGEDDQPGGDAEDEEELEIEDEEESREKAEEQEAEEERGQEEGLEGAGGGKEEEAAENAVDAEIEGDEGEEEFRLLLLQEEGLSARQEDVQVSGKPSLGSRVGAHGLSASPPAAPRVGDAKAPVLAIGPSSAGQLARRHRKGGAPAPGPQRGAARAPNQAAGWEYVRGRGRGAPTGGPNSIAQAAHQRLQELHALELAQAQPEGAAQEVQVEPLSKRMRVSIKRSAARNSPAAVAKRVDVDVLVYVLDWVGVVSLWCCTVALFLAFLRRPLLQSWRQPASAAPRSLTQGLLGNVRQA